MSAVEELLTELDDLWQEIENAFETVSGDSKALLAELQKSPLLVEKQFVKNPEYSEEAGSHVMDIYLEVHEHHRQLGLLLEKRKMLLNEYLHLCMFDQDSSQVRESYICLVSKILEDFNPGTVYIHLRTHFFDFVSGKFGKTSSAWLFEGSHLYL